MRIKEKAIVLQCIKYGDKKCIVKLFTEQHGLVTAMAMVAKNGKVRSSSLLPLSLITAELVLKQNKEIHQLTETSCYYVSQGFADSMNKLSIAQFLNEILIKALKEQTANTHLFDFIETCIKFLIDTQENYINLHLYFLLELSKYLGFEPQNNFSASECFFDMREGRFSSLSLAFPLGLSKQDSVIFREFLRLNVLQTKLNNAQRQNILETLLAYYSLHLPGFNEIKSVEVLKALNY
jgi:DNA repair protein RecO (recombination protein O)